MPLCDICTTISFQDLPPFPEDEYVRTLTGLEHVQTLIRRRDVPQDATASSVRYHASIEDLRSAAASGCELCLLIQGQADAILAELDVFEAEGKHRYGRPKFDMWLTKRPDGGQGFWVLSECDRAGRSMILPVAALGFAVDEGTSKSYCALAANHEDNALARTLRGRPVKPLPDAQVLQRLVTWNAACERDHECRLGAGPMPARLIDVSSKSGDTVKVVDVNAEERQNYVALTYASESGIPETNLPIDSITVAELPKTFQDAVLVTRTLGVQYLWIDSLCIRDRLQWARDSEPAGSVYANAYLTISATGSENLTDGLFFSRPPRQSLQIPYTSDDITGTVSAFILPLAKEVIRSRYVEMDKEPISKGVWSFQDRVLSRRTVHFASDQMYFECLHDFVSEDGLLEHSRYHTTAEKLPDGTAPSRKRAANATPLSRWNAMLWDYGQRQATVPSDKLPALSNMARAYQRLLDDEYVAGLWKKSLIESLPWQSLHCKAAGADAPSWSWASVDGIPGAGYAASSSYDVEATVVDISVDLQDENKPFGNVRAASIQLEAPLVRLTLCDKHRTEHMFVRTPNSDEDGFYAGFDTIDRRHSVSADKLRDMELFALLLVETHPDDCSIGTCARVSAHHGLIVTPLDASGDKFKRLGFIIAASSSFVDGELSGSRKTVTFV